MKSGLLIGRRNMTPEQRRAQDRAYYAATRDRQRERAKVRRDSLTAEQRAQRKAYLAEWHAKNSERVRENDVRYKYGITAGAYRALLLAQGGVCAICERPEADVKGRRLHVDHCHESGRVRGLLCARCNLAVGQMFDDPARLRAAAAYLEGSAR